MTYIIKYLKQYVPTEPKKTPAAHATSARILTIEECFKMIFECEEKKRKVREQNKKEREEAAKLRAKIIEKRKAEAVGKREKVVKKKAESARRKDTARSEWRNKGCTKSHKRSNDNGAATNAKRYCVDGDNGRLELSNEGSIAPTEDYVLLEDVHNSVKDGTVNTADDGNQGCVCFRTYEEDQIEEAGFLWVQCVCGRWLHEDCYSKVAMDKYGRELICPYCVL